jgi:DNA-binding response OmpR family regulator
MATRESRKDEAVESPSLLIVEDDPNLSSVLESYFSYKRYRVETVREGDKALEAIRAAGPDVLFLDWRLPGKTGAEVLREARADGIDAPAIMVSVHSEDELKRKIGDPGADAYVTKPFDLEDLEERVGALLS